MKVTGEGSSVLFFFSLHAFLFLLAIGSGDIVFRFVFFFLFSFFFFSMFGLSTRSLAISPPQNLL